jgi:hypothetical protein
MSSVESTLTPSPRAPSAQMEQLMLNARTSGPDRHRARAGKRTGSPAPTVSRWLNRLIRPRAGNISSDYRAGTLGRLGRKSSEPPDKGHSPERWRTENGGGRNGRGEHDPRKHGG